MAPQNNNNDSHIFANNDQKRGLIIVIVLCCLATVGMFCLILTLVILKNKRDRKKRAAKMHTEKHVLKGKGRYQRLEDGVWSTEMGNRAVRNDVVEVEENVMRGADRV
jgi:hypothetical protein